MSLLKIEKKWNQNVDPFKPCKVLRLTKAPRGGKVDLGDERAEIVKRLSYENNVIVSHFSSCEFIHINLVANTV